MAEVLTVVEQMLLPLLEGTDMFIVNVKTKPINNIKIYLDAESGLSIEKCAQINRKLRHMIDEAGMFPEGDYSLEVSSPGVDEPLTERQYKKNIGRTVLVTVNEGPEELGVLREVNDTSIVLEQKVHKKKETTLKEVPKTDIKKIVVQVIF